VTAGDEHPLLHAVSALRSGGADSPADGSTPWNAGQESGPQDARKPLLHVPFEYNHRGLTLLAREHAASARCAPCAQFGVSVQRRSGIRTNTEPGMGNWAGQASPESG